MNIHEMHNTFRTLGQQAGMQLIRGILPESIDVCLNDVIMQKVRVELLQGVALIAQNNGNMQTSTMTQINLFKTLYHSVRYSIDTTDVDESTKKVSYYNPDNGFHIINVPVVGSDVEIADDEYKISPMMFLGFSVEYDSTLRGNSIACRIIGSDVLEATLRDYCNTASKDYPIVCLTSAPVVENNIEQIGAILNEQLEVYTNHKGCSIKFLNIKYIKTPNVVKYDTDISKCVNCDLPDYTHFDIVEQAVLKFRESIGIRTPSQSTQQV